MSFDSDLLDDIFSQPSSAPERALGKFLPKAQKKNEKVVQQHISSDHPVKDGERVSTVLAPKGPSSTEGCMDKPGSPLCDPNSNDSLQMDQGNSDGQTEVILPGSDSLDDILPELATTTERVRGKFQPKVRPSVSKLVPSSLGHTSTCKSLSSGSNPHGASTPFEAQEFVRSSNLEDPVSDCHTGVDGASGKTKEKETGVSTGLESLEESPFHASEASEAPVLRAATSFIDGDLQTDQGPSGGEKINVPFDMGSVDNEFSLPDVIAYSEAIVADHSVDVEVDHGRLQAERINSRKRKLPGRVGSTTEDSEVNDGNQSCRQLRKRTSVCTVVNEPGDGNDEDWGIGGGKSNDSQVAEESSDDEYIGQRSSKKRAPRKSRGSQDEKEKPTRRHKKASFGSDSSTQEPRKKKFSHSTRRSKRQVDKVLLEIPEEDIDPMRLSIKDLIMLAEARERVAVQEPATNRQSTRDQSDSSFFNNASFGNDNQEQDLNVDGDEANQTVNFSSTKLNYHTYMTRTRSDRWSKVDTELFYQAVRQFGTDFAMIQQLFPSRTRHQIKLKFKNEERKHPLQIADALIHRSKDNSQFELVIQRLQAQEEENSNADVADDDDDDDDARDESQTKTSENEEEDHAKVDKKEEEEVDGWDQGDDSVNPNEYEDVFDWSQYDFQNSSSPYGTEKDEYNIF